MRDPMPRAGYSTAGGRRRTSRLVPILIAVVAVLGVGALAAFAFAVLAPQGAPSDPNPGPSAQSTANPDARNLCDSTSLAVNVGAPTPSAGSTALPLEFSNVSSQPCVLKGHPTVAFVGTDGTPVGASSVPNESEPAESVEIAPGASATATLVILAAPVDGCDAVAVERIQITLPDSEEYFVLDTAGKTACENSDLDLLSVTAISAS